jgi:pilus assembly protein CpaD
MRNHAFLRPRHAALALAFALGGCLGAHEDRNFGVGSIRQPVVAGDRAYVPGCPDWSSAGRDSAALTDSNYGCAVNSNLAAMVANPQDLLHGKVDTGTDSDSATRAVKAWREAAATSKLWTTTAKEAATSGGPQ